jgi:hypothetical protein
MSMMNALHVAGGKAAAPMRAFQKTPACRQLPRCNKLQQIDRQRIRGNSQHVMPLPPPPGTTPCSRLVGWQILSASEVYPPMAP